MSKICWMSHGGHMGWFKWVNNGWDFCGMDYQPAKDDVIQGLES